MFKEASLPLCFTEFKCRKVVRLQGEFVRLQGDSEMKRTIAKAWVSLLRVNCNRHHVAQAGLRVPPRKRPRDARSWPRSGVCRMPRCCMQTESQERKMRGTEAENGIF